MASTPRPYRPSALSDNDALNSMMPASSAKTVTPSDSVYFDKPTSAIYVGTGGDVSVVHEKDSDGTRDTVVVYKNVLSGSYLLGRFVKIRATGTTAIDIVAQFT
jgi:hypothetical protein